MYHRAAFQPGTRATLRGGQSIPDRGDLEHRQDQWTGAVGVKWASRREDRCSVAKPRAAGYCSHSQGLYSINKAVFSKGACKFSERKHQQIMRQWKSSGIYFHEVRGRPLLGVRGPDRIWRKQSILGPALKGIEMINSCEKKKVVKWGEWHPESTVGPTVISITRACYGSYFEMYISTPKCITTFYLLFTLFLLEV